MVKNLFRVKQTNLPSDDIEKVKTYIPLNVKIYKSEGIEYKTPKK